MNNFEIINKLGKGRYSSVYKVRRKVDNQIYALKKADLKSLNNKEKENALNEIRILASLNNKYIIKYKEAFIDEKDNTLNLVMEFADEGDLLHKICEKKEKSEIFTEDEIWKILIQLVKGLRTLHNLNILHRDIKSANIFIFNNGNVKLGDLNVAKITKGGLGYTQIGTPHYASPEMWRDLPYDDKSDIWSLGCVIYELAALSHPFKANNTEKLYQEILKGEIKKIPENYSQELYNFISNLLQINSDKRPSCKDILNNSIIKKKMEYFKEIKENNEYNVLLKTIKISGNNFFKSPIKLPNSNYLLNNVENNFLNENKNSFLPHIKCTNYLKEKFLNNNSVDSKLGEIKKIDENYNNTKRYCSNIDNNNFRNNSINQKKTYRGFEESFIYKKLLSLKNRDDRKKITKLFKEKKSVDKSNEITIRNRGNYLKLFGYTNTYNKKNMEIYDAKLPKIRKMDKIYDTIKVLNK